ncbi:SMI1/KNR4 family protein [Kosakonia cowanii]|uniref:SMI1/KNR4 family protein n=1 Tax=Kosakonia cowanii TaxID=208223 RepID=UPI0039A683F9
MINIKLQTTLDAFKSTHHLTFPERYTRFLAAQRDAIGITTPEGDVIYLYAHGDLLERNDTYAIQQVEPEYLLIGQDGDMGYFIYGKSGRETIYRQDLGALGALPMEPAAESIDQLLA